VSTSKSFGLLALLCLLMGACAQPTNRPDPSPQYVLQGTVHAPAGQDVAGTVVVACYPAGAPCDEAKTKFVEITGGGASAPFRLEGLEDLSYDLYAVKDVDGDNDFFGVGDYYGDTGDTVTPPLSGLSIQMAVLGDGGPVDPGPGVGDPEPYVVKGRVTDRQGNPIPGAQVFADNTAYYDMNVLAVTDANGYYRIELGTVTPSSWRVGAYYQTEFAGERLEFRLHADNDDPFAGPDGAIRNLEWRISGEVPGGGYYGGEVYVYASDVMYENFEYEYIELTFTPDGPLADGSAGEPFTRTLEGGARVLDIPVGRYTVTAIYRDTATGEVLPLYVRPRFQEEYGPEASISFRDDPLYGIFAELELASP
jgi:hypothetical protein